MLSKKNCVINNCNYFSSSNSLNGTHFGVRAEMSIVLNPEAFHSNLLKSNGTLLNSGFWLFIFQNNNIHSDNEITSQIYKYFKLFLDIKFNSQIYVIKQSESAQVLYEIYRKSSGMNVTITALCKSDLHKNKMIFLAEKRIWTRRKDLSGVNFTVGYVLNHTFIKEKNKVHD
jgi:hypothetical protein